MITITRSKDRHTGDFGWLQARWHFSFADYYDANNMGWGPLRVFNDDVIQGGKGFGLHGHKDMEIITYVLGGALERSDSKNNKGVLHPGEVQVMSAGRGIMHSEYNHLKDAPSSLLQIWIEPRTRGREPSYGQKPFDVAGQPDRLVPLASGQGAEGAMTIDADATIYASRASTRSSD